MGQNEVDVYDGPRVWNYSLGCIMSIYYTLWVSLTASWMAALGYGEIHHTYAHLHCEMHACKTVGAHAVMHAWVERG